MNIRGLINIVEAAQRELPEYVYHGTCVHNWTQGGNGEPLYLASTRENAENYADQAAVNRCYELGIEDASEDPSAKAIIVRFKLDDLMASRLSFMPDWGWDKTTDHTSWKDTLHAVGSFCVGGFADADKRMGKVEDAVSETSIVEDALSESFHDGFKIKSDSGQELIVEVYKNPSRDEYRKLLKQNDFVRGILDGETLYVWNGYIATHYDVATTLGGIRGQRLEMNEDGIFIWWEPEYEEYNDALTDPDDLDEVREYLMVHPALAKLVTGEIVFSQ